MVFIYAFSSAVLSAELNFPINVPWSGILRSGTKMAISGLGFLSVKLNVKSCGFGSVIVVFRDGTYFFKMVF